jgi:hypothetical protein
MSAWIGLSSHVRLVRSGLATLWPFSVMGFAVAPADPGGQLMPFRSFAADLPEQIVQNRSPKAEIVEEDWILRTHVLPYSVISMNTFARV